MPGFMDLHGGMIVNWLFPGVIVIVLMLTARPKQKPMKPERYTTAMANAEEVTATGQGVDGSRAV